MGGFSNPFTDMLKSQSLEPVPAEQRPPEQEAMGGPVKKAASSGLLGLLRSMASSAGDAALQQSGAADYQHKMADMKFKAAQAKNMEADNARQDALLQDRLSKTEVEIGGVKLNLKPNDILNWIKEQAKIKAAGERQDKQIAAGVENREDQQAFKKENPPVKTPNRIGLVIAAQQGDAEAKKALDTIRADEERLVKLRGDSFGRGRLWSIQKMYLPETGETVPMTGFEALRRRERGESVISAGALSQKEIISVQQLQSEAVPAVQEVRQHIKAFDNASDRAIFARVMEGAGKPAYGQEAGWMGSVLNQSLKENLSPEGKLLAVRLSRLAETMGRLRSTIGLPATDQSMQITLQLLPGKSTPNSQYASQQVDQVEAMIKQAVSIPAFGGVPRKVSEAMNAGKVVEQFSPSRNQYRHSVDGGKTWQTGRAPRK